MPHLELNSLMTMFNMTVSNDNHVSLRAAAQYAHAFSGKTFVVKLGGEVLENVSARRAICEQLHVLWRFSIRVVLVHGGGRSLDAVCESLDLPVKKVAGRRITSPEVLEASKMVFAGSLHMDFLADIRAAGLSPVGISGIDGALLTAHRRGDLEIEDDQGQHQSVDFGLVGDIDKVDPALISHLLAGGFMPVVAPLSGNDQGEIFNTNADTIAAQIAIALQAEKLIFLLQVPGLLEDPTQPASLIPSATVDEIRKLSAGRSVSGGMRPKLAAITDALSGGVKSAHLISGLAVDSVLTEVFTNQGIGTMIVSSDSSREATSA